jgi:hypothetical protein
MAMPIPIRGPMVHQTAMRRSVLFSALTVGLGVIAAAVVLTSGSIARSSSATAPARSALSAAPAGLQSAASAAIGAQKAFSIRHQGASLVSAGGGISTVFASSGPIVQLGNAKLGLSLAGVGYGSHLSKLGSAAPVATGSQVAYSRTGITEWYKNGPLGLEQGFTLAQRPAGSSAQGLLTVAVRASGPLELAQQGANVVVTGSTGATVAQYGGLTAVDASGRLLASKLVLQNGTLLLHVNDAGARYPLTIDPLLQEGSKLVGTGATGNAGFGGNPSGGNPSTALYRANIAISTDGTTAIIGGAADNTNVGAVWIFTQSGGVWTQQGAKLTGTGETGAGLFGSSVALSSDGNTALVGAPADNSSVGAAFVFTRSAGVWTQQTVTPLTGAAGGESGSGDFGSAVALSANGNTALIGARRDFIPGGGGTNPGTAYPFLRTGTTWAPQGTRLIRSDNGASFLAFGAAVALSADGNTALIGASADGNGPGAAYVFFRTGTTWAQQAKIIPSDTTASSHAGMSVSLSSDGNTALIGGPGDTSSDAGAAWIFTRSGTTWTQFQSKLTPSDETGFGFFGSSVALSQDGTTAVIGASQNASATGGAWSFKLVNGLWEQNGNTFSASDETGAGQLGGSVAISGDGSQFLAGANTDNGGVGAAFAFDLALPAAPTNVTAVAADGQATVSFTAPPTNGGPITEFTAISHPDGHYWQGTSSPITVSGLTDGTSYTFTVVGDDSVGTGPESADSNAVTPSGPAPAVTTTATTTAVSAPTTTASATPSAAGTVTSSNGTSVVWPAGTFSVPVTVTAAPATGVTATLAAGTFAISLVVTTAAGVPVTAFSAPIELVFPNSPANAVPAYSHDGVTWTAIPQLTGTTLPAGYPDGWFRDSSGSLHILTLHATDFAPLATGSVVSSALELSVGVRRTLNLNYGHTLTMYLHSTLPATSNITFVGKAKVLLTTRDAKGNAFTTFATVKPALTGLSQIVTIALPKTARHTGPFTLTLTSSSGALTTSQAIKIALVAHWNKKG